MSDPVVLDFKIDPARREGATRLASPDDWSPSLTTALEIAGRLPTGIKLGPGMDRALLPEGLEAQWISVDGEVVELVVWSGGLARPGVRPNRCSNRPGHPGKLAAPKFRPLILWAQNPGNKSLQN